MKISISVKVTVGIFDSFIFFMGWSCAVLSMRFSDSHREKKNDFAVLCSIYISDFEYSPKVFPVGATSIYLLEV